MPRLFTGLEIPPDLRLLLSLKRGGLPGARWIDPENYHITLRFVGDVDHAMAREIEAELHRLRTPEPATLVIDRFGQFGGDKPRTLIAGIVPDAALGGLHAAQDRLMQRLGLRPDGRKFTPHVTLARLRDTSAGELTGYMTAMGPFTPLTFRPERFVLFSSKDSVGGGPYRIEAAYPLAA